MKAKKKELSVITLNHFLPLQFWWTLNLAKPEPNVLSPAGMGFAHSGKDPSNPADFICLVLIYNNAAYIIGPHAE